MRLSLQRQQNRIHKHFKTNIFPITFTINVVIFYYVMAQTHSTWIIVFFNHLTPKKKHHNSIQFLLKTSSTLFRICFQSIVSNNLKSCFNCFETSLQRHVCNKSAKFPFGQKQSSGCTVLFIKYGESATCCSRYFTLIIKFLQLSYNLYRTIYEPSFRSKIFTHVLHTLFSLDTPSIRTSKSSFNEESILFF